MGEVLSFLSANDKLVTAWTAIAALFVSFISIVIAILNMAMQRGHNRKSVLPIGHVSVADYLNEVVVRLRNDGIGPMIVEKLEVIKNKDEQPACAIIDLMPELPTGYFWSGFVSDISGRAISAQDNITLIRLEGDPNDAAFVALRREVRKALSNLTVKVEYKNIYGEKMPPAIRKLTWFNRYDG